MGRGEMQSPSVSGEIHVTKGPKAGEVYPLRAGSTLFLGRDPKCQIQILSNRVSRYNTMVEWKADAVRISDLESANGTFVNGEKVKEATLVPGDSFRVGEYEFEYRQASG